MVSPSAAAVKTGSESDESSLGARGVVRTHETEYEDEDESEERAKRQRRLDEATLETNGRDGGESKEANYSPAMTNLTEASLAPLLLQQQQNPTDDQGTRSILDGRHA